MDTYDNMLNIFESLLDSNSQSKDSKDKLVDNDKVINASYVIIE